MCIRDRLETDYSHSVFYRIVSAIKGWITANGTAVKGDASANAGGTVEMTGGSVDGRCV